MDERQMFSGSVYFAIDSNGMCKIGASRNVDKRIMQIGNDIHKEIKLHHYILTNDIFWLETKLHNFFQAKKVESEWFNLTKEDLEEVAKMIRCDNLVINGESFDKQAERGNMTKSAMILGRKGGLKGGASRANKLTPERRSEIARMGGLARQRKPKD